ncbi:MAG: spermidine synthase, partial [Myxococcota bacterium]
VILAFVAPGRPWQVLRFGPLSAAPAAGTVEFFEVGRSATVLVLQQGGKWRLRTNGLPEAGILPPGHPPANTRTSRWLTALPLLARPEARSLLVIGLGGGVAVERLSPGLERIDVVELEPQVVAANREFSPLRALDPLADPRLRVVENDARGALILSDVRYDMIVSQPSHPWTAGASHLYTREFFALTRERLSPDGALLQWIGPAFVDEELLQILVATLRDVFEHVVVHQPHEAGGILLLASAAPLDPVAGAPAALAVAPEVFAALGVYSPEDVAATQLLDDEGTERFAAGAPINLDRRNHLQMRSPQLLRSGKGPLAPAPIVTEAGLAPEFGAELDPLLLISRMLDQRFGTLAATRAAELEDPVDRAVASALLHDRAGRRGKALSALRLALEQRPDHALARETMFRLRGPAAFGEKGLPVSAAGPLELAVRAALDQLEAPGFDAGAWAALDAQLAQATPGTPFFLAATRLRGRWRLLDGSPEALREAIRLIDISHSRRGGAPDLLLRARLGAALEDPVVVLSSLEGWLSATMPARRKPSEFAAAKKLLAELPDTGRWEPWRQYVTAGLVQPRGRPASRPIAP